MVAYIYAYNNGIKKQNTGFAKIEYRGNNLKVQINMKSAYTDMPGMWQVYFFQRNDGLEEVIKLGEIKLQGGLGEFRNMYDTENISQSGIGFKNIAGLLISKDRETQKVFASEWDDNGFYTEKIAYERIIKTEDSLVEFEPVIEEPVLEAAEVKEEPEPVLEAESKEIKTGWDRIYEDREKQVIFADDELYDVVEITTEDIDKMPELNWGLKNNPFITHSFYTFRHLILARQNNGEEVKYILGVPGIYSRRERAIASMYGFNRFKFSMRSDVRLSQFGYWYIFLGD